MTPQEKTIVVEAPLDVEKQSNKSKKIEQKWYKTKKGIAFIVCGVLLAVLGVVLLVFGKSEGGFGSLKSVPSAASKNSQERIFISRVNDNGRFELISVDLNGKNLKIHRTSADFGISFMVSDDEKFLFYNPRGTNNLKIMKLDTNETDPVVEKNNFGIFFSIDSKGKRIAYQDSNDKYIKVIDFDGTSLSEATKIEEVQSQIYPFITGNGKSINYFVNKGATIEDTFSRYELNVSTKRSVKHERVPDKFGVLGASPDGKSYIYGRPLEGQPTLNIVADSKKGHVLTYRLEDFDANVLPSVHKWTSDAVYISYRRNDHPGNMSGLYKLGMKELQMSPVLDERGKLITLSF